MNIFADRPFIVIWEVTRACALACVHCRAAAIPRRDPDELTTDEGKALLERVAAFGSPLPLMVLTGGDPLRRPDLASLVERGARLGLSVSLTPSGTGAATAARLGALREAGLARLAVSLDAATPDAHHAFRRVRGSHARTLGIIEDARALGLPLQILDLRDPGRLGGRCGRCEYRERCGGSRARAFALTGDPLAEDPGCAHVPAERAR